MDLLQACRVKSENAETTAKTQNFILREPCSTLCTDHRRTRRGVGEGGVGRTPRLEKFQGKFCFQRKRELLKILNDKKYFNAVKISRATLFFRTSASRSKILNDKKHIFNTVRNSRATLFFRASASCSKIPNIKSIFNTVKHFRVSFFSGQAQSRSKILNAK